MDFDLEVKLSIYQHFAEQGTAPAVEDLSHRLRRSPQEILKGSPGRLPQTQELRARWPRQIHYLAVVVAQRLWVQDCSPENALPAKLSGCST